MEPIPAQISHEPCTVCKNAAATFMRGALMTEPPYLAYRLCRACVYGSNRISAEQRLSWNQNLWEQAALDLGEPPGSGDARRLKGPPGAPFAPANEPCTNCDRFIGDEPFSRSTFHDGLLPFVLCKGCSDRANTLQGEALKAFSKEVENKALLIHGGVGGRA